MNSNLESFVRNLFSDRSGRPVNEAGEPSRLLRPEYQITGPSPDVLRLQQLADQLQFDLEHTRKVLQLQQRADQLQIELERSKKRTDQLQLELECTEKELSLRKQGFESDGGNQATSTTLVQMAPDPHANERPVIPEHQQRADQLQLELKRTKIELSSTKQELESNRVFGNKADVVSETDIITKVNSLNDCIYQMASAIADAHLDDAIRLSDNQLSNSTKSFFGESLCNFVVDTKQNSAHPRILVSLQACMNHFCVLILSSEFDSIVKPEKTQILQQISNAIKASQPKVVFARWRALVYSDNQASQILKQDQQPLLTLLIHHLSSLYGFPETKLQPMFEEEFSQVVNKTMDLRKTVYGDYVSGDVEILAPSPGSQFDPEKMQVDDPKGKTKEPVAGPIVMCTTAMGIARTLYIQRRQGDRWVDEKQYDVLSRANVVVSFDD